MTATILLVDDDETALSFMAPMLSDSGYDVRQAATLAEAHAVVGRGEADIVVLDVQLPDGYGPTLLDYIQRETPGVQVVVVTGYGDIEMAVEAMKHGARDFIQKPVDMTRLRQAVEKCAEQVALHRELEHLRTERGSNGSWVVGETATMKRLASDLARVAPTNATVLITGPSGSGKEVLAAAVHRMSNRAGKPFVAVSCANFTDTLLDAELFGHEVGIFTDAKKRRDGLFLVADGGTLFLDEISAMKPELQAKLLRVLEVRSVRRLGGASEIRVDVRVVAATNRNLAEMVAQGEFREDLYHRLNVVSLHLPPLRERLTDIPALVGHFLSRLNAEMGRNVAEVSPTAIDMLKAHAWPGNIRQLRNALERAMLFADGDTLEIGHFAPDIVEAAALPA